MSKSKPVRRLKQVSDRQSVSQVDDDDSKLADGSAHNKVATNGNNKLATLALRRPLVVRRRSRRRNGNIMNESATLLRRRRRRSPKGTARHQERSGELSFNQRNYDNNNNDTMTQPLFALAQLRANASAATRFRRRPKGQRRKQVRDTCLRRVA